MGNQLVSEEPERETPEVNRSIISCHGRGDTESVSVVINGCTPYTQTGMIAAEAVKHVIASDFKANGYSTPCDAFGARTLLSALEEKGFVTCKVRSE